ncbi:hypothetical protein Dsin_004755 [Dipteronia sinensis]|uniref:Uncharacterized protein n=1 Tax=Dipteronia sinensis TaxID=43782 RepID=A0AAE0AV97_9ROSI|nr:hypothetical protein Dsin_004755 [Dipteronia sinensis]
MGFHLVALAKLKYVLMSPSHHATITPLLATMICPFLLKFSCSFSLIRQAYIDLLHASSLFAFQLQQIAFNTEPPLPRLDGNGNVNNNGSSRWDRALRLVCQRITHVRPSPPTQSDEDSFHTLTVLSL